MACGGCGKGNRANQPTPTPLNGKPCGHTKAVDWCKVCWLFDNDPQYNRLYNGKGIKNFCRKRGNDCKCKKKEILQVHVSAAGLGDHILGLCACEGLRKKHPDKDIVYSVNSPGMKEWMKLFNGYDHLTTRKIEGVKTVQPHDSYAEQMLTQSIPTRDAHYSVITGAPCVLPDAFPLPKEAKEWAKKYLGAVLLFTHSEWQDRTYPIQSWHVLERLFVGAGYQVVVVDTQAERNKSLRSEKVINDKPAHIAALVETAALVIGCDSGGNHLAGILRTPSIALCNAIDGNKIFNLYPTVKVLNSPLICSDHHWQGFMHPNADCNGSPCLGLANITPETIFQVALDILPERPPSVPPIEGDWLKD